MKFLVHGVRLPSLISALIIFTLMRSISSLLPILEQAVSRVISPCILAMANLLGALKPVAVPSERKRRATEADGRSDENRELLELVAKLTLSNAHRSRQLMAAVAKTYRVMTESQFATLIQQEVKMFVETAEEMRTTQAVMSDQITEQIGVPECHAFNGAVKAGLALMKDDDPRKEQVKKSAAKWTSWQMLHKDVKLFKLEKCYDSKMRNLLVRMEDSSQPSEDALLTPFRTWTILEDVLLKEHAKHRELVGAAPTGDLEKRIQDLWTKNHRWRKPLSSHWL